MEREFHRIWRLPPYLFAEVNELKARARAAGEDIIDFGIGNPDRPTPPHIVEKMVETARDPRAHRYSTSLSKTYSMPGWRVGFCVGNEKLVGALARVTSYLDYGAFTPIQVAAVAALNGPQDCVDEVRALYRERRDTMVDAFGQAGWEVPPPATMFAWAPLPPALAGMGSLEFSKLLLREAKVAVSPGVGFGEYGEGFVRMALVENRQRIRQAARGVRQFLAAAEAFAGEAGRRIAAAGR